MDLEDLVMTDDRLRPQTTSTYLNKNLWSEKAFEFPDLYIRDKFPVKHWQPIDTYAQDHNTRFEERYGKISS